MNDIVVAGRLDIGDSIQELSDNFFGFLPKLGAAVVVLIVAYFLAKILAKLVGRACRSIRLDERLRETPADAIMSRMPDLSLTAALRGLTFWLIFLVGLGEALRLLEIDAVNNGIAAVWAYLPNVIAAIAIVVVAVLLSGFVRDLLERVTPPGAVGSLLTTIVPVLILVIAGFMALTQLKIAEEIVVGTYWLVLGAICLGAALAFGLGGRDAARQAIDDAVRKGRRDLGGPTAGETSRVDPGSPPA